jgi:hypothetical protein
MPPKKNQLEQVATYNNYYGGFTVTLQELFIRNYMAKHLLVLSPLRTFLTLAFDEGKTTSVHCSKVTS